MIMIWKIGNGSKYKLDKIRTVDKTRLVKKLGDIDKTKSKEILDMLVKMFEHWNHLNLRKTSFSRFTMIY